MSKSKKDRLGVVFSTNPDFEFTYGSEEEQELLAPAKQNLRVQLDRKNRGGKEVTLITGYKGPLEELEKLCKVLKTKCGVGGAAKDGEIMIQGDHRDKVLKILLDSGYKLTKKSGG